MSNLPLSQLVLESDLLVVDGAFEMIDTTILDDQPMGTEDFEAEIIPETLLNQSADDFLQPSTSFDDWLHNTGPLMSGDAFNDHRYGPSDSDFDRLVNSNHDYYDKVPQMDYNNEQEEHSYAHFLPPHAPGLEDAYVPACATLLNSSTSSSSSSSTSASTPSPAITDNQPVSVKEYLTVPEKKKQREPPVPRMAAEPDPSLAAPDEYDLTTIECLWQDEQGVQCGATLSRCHMEAHVSANHSNRGIKKPLCYWKNCGKSFARRYLMLRHLRSTHINDKPYECSKCLMRFALRERMKLHERVVHGMHPQLKLPPSAVKKAVPPLPQSTPIRTYPCDDCPMTFLTTSARRHHVTQAHLKIRFECELCDQTFFDRSGRTRHRRKVHPGHEVAPVQKAMHRVV